MAIYKVSDDLLLECKKLLQSYTNTSAYKSKLTLGEYMIRRRKKALKLIDKLSENYGI